MVQRRKLEGLNDERDRLLQPEPGATAYDRLVYEAELSILHHRQQAIAGPSRPSAPPVASGSANVDPSATLRSQIPMVVPRLETLRAVGNAPDALVAGDVVLSRLRGAQVHHRWCSVCFNTSNLLNRPTGVVCSTCDSFAKRSDLPSPRRPLWNAAKKSLNWNRRVQMAMDVFLTGVTMYPP
jgi:hypothetical protein